MIVAFELLHCLCRKGNGKGGWLALKLDISNAYDRVEWEFLMGMMKKMGFGNRWISLVMQCISTPKFAFLINGEPVGKVRS